MSMFFTRDNKDSEKSPKYKARKALDQQSTMRARSQRYYTVVITYGHLASPPFTA